MSKKNYTNYSKNPESIKEPFINEPIIEKEEKIEEVVEAVEPVETEDTIEASEIVDEPEVEPIYGCVDKCEKLRVRKGPSTNTGVVTVISAGTEVMIDLDKSTNDWYSVRTATGVEGFCMKDFITIK